MGNSQPKDSAPEAGKTVTITAFGNELDFVHIAQLPPNDDSECFPPEDEVVNYPCVDNFLNFIAKRREGNKIDNITVPVWSSQGSGFFLGYDVNCKVVMLCRWKDGKMQRDLVYCSDSTLRPMSVKEDEREKVVKAPEIKFHQGSLFVYCKGRIVYCLPDPEMEIMRGHAFNKKYPVTFDPIRSDTLLGFRVINPQQDVVCLSRYSTKLEMLMTSAHIFVMGYKHLELHADFSGLVFSSTMMYYTFMIQTYPRVKDFL